MRKIFFALMLATVCLTYAPSAAAQDVWICSGGDGLEWYILDETISGDGQIPLDERSDQTRCGRRQLRRCRIEIHADKS